MSIRKQYEAELIEIIKEKRIKVLELIKKAISERMRVRIRCTSDFDQTMCHHFLREQGLDNNDLIVVSEESGHDSLDEWRIASTALFT